MSANSLLGARGENYDRLVCQEELILEVTERLTEALQDAHITRAELAQRLRRTPGFVSQVLAGGRNLTLRTIADMAGALSLRPSFVLSSPCQYAVSSAQWTYPNPPRTLSDSKSATRSDGPSVLFPVSTEVAWAA